MADEPQTVGDRIRLAREARKWSERELARRSGVDVAWISRLESGMRHNLSLEAAGRIARALDMTLNYLAYGEEDTDIGELCRAMRRYLASLTPLLV